MAIELVTKFLPYVDELFTTESKTAILTNQDFNFDGAHTVKVYKVTTAPMNDYDRAGTGSNWSRYGAVKGLDATTETFTLEKDRSFTFAIDALDNDETAQQLAAASALARQLREVVVPEVDAYTLGEMIDNAGTTAETKALKASDLYNDIIEANAVLDAAEVPDIGRVLVVTPTTYVLMKQCRDIVLETDIGQNMRLRGVIGNLDGLTVLRVPASRLPEDFGFMIAHPSATVAPTKLESFKTHNNPPGINGDLVEGRIVYGAFILENKAKAIYYQPIAEAEEPPEPPEEDEEDQTGKNK